MRNGKGRPSLKHGESSVSINVRLPESDFDDHCARVKYLEKILDRPVSLAEGLRMRLPEKVDESIYGPDDGRPAVDARIVDALLKMEQKRSEEFRDVSKEAISIAKDTLQSEREAVSYVRRSMTALVQMAMVTISHPNNDQLHEFVFDLLDSLITELHFPTTKPH